MTDAKAHPATIDTVAADCPPPEASVAHGEVYRCCKSDPPRAADMVTCEESSRFPEADPCLRRALSAFRDLRDAEHQARLFPGWKRRFVAKAQLFSAHGSVMATSGGRPTHTSWWPALGLEPASRAELFCVVLEVRS